MPTNDREYYQQWYEKNRKKVLTKIAEPIECECGRTVVKGNISKHVKSKVHKKLMSEKDAQKKIKDYDSLLKKYIKLKDKLNQF